MLNILGLVSDLLSAYKIISVAIQVQEAEPNIPGYLCPHTNNESNANSRDHFTA